MANGQALVTGLSRLCYGRDGRSIRKYLPSIVNQILQSMRGDIQCRRIHRALVTGRGFGALSLQDVVDLVFDSLECSLGVGFPYPAHQSIQSIERAVVCEWPDSQKLP